MAEDMGSTVALRLERYRKPFYGTLDALSEPEREQLQAIIGSDVDSEGMSLEEMLGDDVDEEDIVMKGLEYVDVVDAHGTTVANLLLYGFGDGAIVHAGTTRMIANIVQHGIMPHKTTTPEWMAAFRRAWEEGAARLGVRDAGHIHFR